MLSVNKSKILGYIGKIVFSFLPGVFIWVVISLFVSCQIYVHCYLVLGCSFFDINKTYYLRIYIYIYIFIVVVCNIYCKRLLTEVKRLHFLKSCFLNLSFNPKQNNFTYLYLHISFDSDGQLQEYTQTVLWPYCFTNGNFHDRG